MFSTALSPALSRTTAGTPVSASSQTIAGTDIAALFLPGRRDPAHRLGRPRSGTDRPGDQAQPGGPRLPGETPRRDHPVPRVRRHQRGVRDRRRRDDQPEHDGLGRQPRARADRRGLHRPHHPSGSRRCATCRSSRPNHSTPSPSTRPGSPSTTSPTTAPRASSSSPGSSEGTGSTSTRGISPGVPVRRTQRSLASIRTCTVVRGMRAVLHPIADPQPAIARQNHGSGRLTPQPANAGRPRSVPAQP
jgi:hypothetical protein